MKTSFTAYLGGLLLSVGVGVGIGVAGWGAEAGGGAETGGVVTTVKSVVESDLAGVRLGDLVDGPVGQGAEDRVLLDSPGFDKTNLVSRAKLLEAIQSRGGMVATNWVIPEGVRVVRRHRVFEEAEMLRLLTERVQKDVVREAGELELTVVRPWVSVRVPTDPVRLKVLEFPVTGVNPSFILRFELVTARETVGQWQVQVTAKIWKEMVVTLSATRRGQLLKDADVRTERRDLLAYREPLMVEQLGDNDLEFREMLMPNQVVLARSVRQKPVVLRGRLVDAALRGGALNVSLKVEAMEDGAVGQLIRVRNPQTRKEFMAKVESDRFVVALL